jgi:hypothetical protein
VASPATPAPLDLPDSPEHPASPALVEELRHLESPELLDSPETTAPLASPEALDSLEHLRRTKPRELHLLAHQETPEHPDSLEAPDSLASLVVLALLARRVLLAPLDSPEALDSPDRPDSLVNPDPEASVESAPNTVPSTAVCSSRTEPEDAEHGSAATAATEAGSRQKNSHFHAPVPTLSPLGIHFAAFCLICSFPCKKVRTAIPR